MLEPLTHEDIAARLLVLENKAYQLINEIKNLFQDVLDSQE
jgi:hypothetical protein